MRDWQAGELNRCKILNIAAAAVFAVWLMAPCDALCIAVEVTGLETEEATAQPLLSAALFSSSPAGKWASSVTVRSAKDGFATAWMFLPAEFTVTNFFTATAGHGESLVQAELAAWLWDEGGTGVVMTNTDRVPMPLA